jgi:acyl-CoA synthetase (NDP forming)
LFGSLLSFGLSGITSELLGDRAYRPLPLSTVDAAELIREPRAAPLLSGYRGEPSARLDALEDLALRLNRLAQDLPEVRSLVLDPVLAGPDGVAVSGARIVVGAPPTPEHAGPRRLQ